MRMHFKQVGGPRRVTGNFPIENEDNLYLDTSIGPVDASLPPIFRVGALVRIHIAPETSATDTVTIRPHATTTLDGLTTPLVITTTTPQMYEFLAVSATEWETRIAGSDRVAKAGDTMTGTLAIDEGLGLGNIALNPVTVNMVIDDQLGSTLEANAYGFSATDGTASTAAAAGQITLLSAPGTPALPTLPEQVTTKSYVDSLSNVITYDTTSATPPATANVGDLLIVTSDGTSAGTITEKWVYDGTSWVQIPLGAGANVTISDTAPATPSAGDLWFDSTNHVMLIWYFDGTNNAWVDVSGTAVAGGAGGGATTLGALTDVDLITTPPVPGDFLVYNGASWQPIDISTGYLPLTGGTMSSTNFSIDLQPSIGTIEIDSTVSTETTTIRNGQIFLSSGPGTAAMATFANHVTTKAYVDAAIAGVSGGSRAWNYLAGVSGSTPQLEPTPGNVTIIDYLNSVDEVMLAGMSPGGFDFRSTIWPAQVLRTNPTFQMVVYIQQSGFDVMVAQVTGNYLDTGFTIASSTPGGQAWTAMLFAR